MPFLHHLCVVYVCLLDNSTGELLVLLEKMSVQYEATLHNLRTINSTVSQVLQLLDTMNGAIGLQLQWVTHHLGGAQDGLKILVVLATHAFFLLLSSLVLLFVRAPWVSRLALLLGVVCNMMAELKLGSSLTLAQLSAAVVAILIGEVTVSTDWETIIASGVCMWTCVSALFVLPATYILPYLYRIVS